MVHYIVSGAQRRTIFNKNFGGGKHEEGWICNFICRFDGLFGGVFVGVKLLSRFNFGNLEERRLPRGLHD
jgi:hypothetical protein